MSTKAVPNSLSISAFSSRRRALSPACSRSRITKSWFVADTAWMLLPLLLVSVASTCRNLRNSHSMVSTLYPLQAQHKLVEVLRLLYCREGATHLEQGMRCRVYRW